MTIQTFQQAALVLACSLLLVATVWDVAFRTIPNWLCAALAILAGALRAQEGDLGGALLASLVVFLIAVFCWRRGWLGGGDVKLLTAAVLLVGPGRSARTARDGGDRRRGSFRILFTAIRDPARSARPPIGPDAPADHPRRTLAHRSPRFPPLRLRDQRWRLLQLHLQMRHLSLVHLAAY